jgi:hypothetical protein
MLVTGSKTCLYLGVHLSDSHWLLARALSSSPVIFFPVIVLVVVRGNSWIMGLIHFTQVFTTYVDDTSH